MKLKSKIFTKIIIAAVLVGLLAPSFALPLSVYAQAQPGGQVQQTVQQEKSKRIEIETSGEMQTNCLPRWFGGGGFNLYICVSEIEAIMGNSVLWLISILLDITENFFNYAVEENLSVKRFDPEQQPMIKQGWTIIRDTTNLFFIFILLIIAIGVIIGWETYGVKKALPTLIIVVLLINFSLLFTRYVIEFSNTLALYFYEQTTGQKYNPSGAKLELSDQLLSGLEPSKILEAYKDPENLRRLAHRKEIEQAEKNLAWQEKCLELRKNNKGCYFWKFWWGEPTVDEQLKAVQKAEEQLESLKNQAPEGAPLTKENLFSTIFASTIFGVIILLVAAFVFLAAAILLVFRIVMLWFTMILAPAAFLLWALPATKEYGRRWLTYLFNQSFFLPVLMFFLYLSVQLIIGNQVGEETLSAASGIIPEVADKVYPSIASRAIVEEGFVFNYAIVIMLMIMSLWFAQKMGAYGSSTVMAWGGKAKEMALGYVGAGGKWAWRAVSYGPRYGTKRGWDAFKGRITRPPEEKTGFKGGILQRTLGRVAPGQMAQIRAGIQKDIDKLKKQYEQYGNFDLKEIYNRKLTTPKQRAAIAEILASRKDMAGLNEKYTSQAVKMMKDAGRATGEIEQLGYQWATPTADDKLSPELEESFRKMRIKTLADIYEQGGDALEKFLKNIEVLRNSTRVTTPGIKGLAEAFEKLGNTAMAAHLRTRRGEEMYGEVFGGQTEKAEGAAKKTPPKETGGSPQSTK